MRIAAPAAINHQETLPVREFAIMDLTGTFRDPLSREKHQLNHSIETNYFTTAVVGSLTYEKGHAHCKGSNVSINGEHMMSLLVTVNF